MRSLSLRVSRVGINGRSDSCRQKGVEHVLDHIGDSLDAVAAWIAHRLHDGWEYSYSACHRQRYSTGPSRSRTKDNERHCSDLGPLTCSGRRAVRVKPLRLLGIANFSGEKGRVENLVRRIKEIENIKNEWVVFTGSTRRE
jgi:hypothetical protein